MKLLAAFLLVYCCAIAFVSCCNNYPCNGYTSPCHNHGKCIPDKDKRCGVYSCQCQDGFAGSRCERRVHCAPHVCGVNEDCVVRNNQVLCTCKRGKSCSVGTRKACMHGDPHFDTYDGFKASYHGTCPVIVSQNRQRIAGFPDFKLVGTNDISGQTARISWLEDMEFTVYGQRMYFRKIGMRFYFNGEQMATPFFWPNERNQQIRVNWNGKEYIVETEHNIRLMFQANYGCMWMPEVTAVRGKLMGLFGNFDGNLWNDMMCLRGNQVPIHKNDYFYGVSQQFVHCQDSYITTLHDRNNHTACVTGLTLHKKREHCDGKRYNLVCKAIMEAAGGAGVFGKCKVMGEATIHAAHQDCILAMCASESNKCQVMEQFATRCAKQLKAGDSIGAWRSSQQCPINCRANAVFKYCASACPATCDNLASQQICKHNCLEECECEPGYVRDNTETAYVKCIRMEECGCKGPQGRWHQARQSFLNDRCNLYSGCYGGKYVSKAISCSKDATCTVTNGIRQCQCKNGFVGDGYNCGKKDNAGKVITPVAPQCNICASYPCRNGGQCVMDMADSCHKYKCGCKNPFAGPHCETHLKCEQNSCGTNAECKVENSQLTCTCKKGHDGDPYNRGCIVYKKSCITQNRLSTLGWMSFTMTGTCPLLVFKNKKSIAHHEDFQFIARQKLSAGNYTHTVIGDSELTIANQSIHVNDNLKVLVNGMAVLPPYYWPNQKDWRIQVTQNYWRVSVEARHSYKVDIQRGRICVSIPSGSDFEGKRVFEGIGGNIGFKLDDLVCRNGQIFPATKASLSSENLSVSIAVAECLASWKTEMKTKKHGKCIDGPTIVKKDQEQKKCVISSLKPFEAACKPIKDAINGTGILGKCQKMDQRDIQTFYDDCLMGICLDINSKCDHYAAFATTCAEQINTFPGDWRSAIKCPKIECGINQEHRDCASQCQDTCAKRQNEKCDRGCREGCVCQSGYLIDNTVTEKIVCIKESACGCTDQMGKWYHGNSTWLSNQCKSLNFCESGVLRVTRNECGANAFCAEKKGIQTCKCKDGFMGDGYTCKKIEIKDEVLIPPKQGEHDICATAPCKNGGICLRDSQNQGTKFSCKCPSNFGGSLCDDLLECNGDSCGENAKCTVKNNKKDCVCNKGYAGNPLKSCGRIRSACISQDPHMITFDGLEADYHGTCPYLFTSSCGNSLDGYTPFQVILKNQLSDGEDERYLSWVYESEIELFNQTIHLDMQTNTLAINQIKQNPPFYWPNENKPKLSITYRGSTFRIVTHDGIEFTFGNYKFCANLPEVAAFKKSDALCGIAGNIDDNWQNDVVCRNKEVLKLSKKSYFFDFSYTALQKCQDSWITRMKTVKGDHNKCQTAETLGRLYGNSSCDVELPTKLCQPIKLTAQGKGPFAKCEMMGEKTINTFFQDCIVEVCPNSTHICKELEGFASACRDKIPQDTDLGNWRSSTSCSLRCPAHSIYSTCKSACPETCAEKGKTTCDKGCLEGCECLPGYVLDNTVSDRISCIKKEECGCTDMNGNWHRASNPFLTNNCQFVNQCDNGTLVEKSHTCGKNSLCVVANSKMQCSCKYGFAGDGYHCSEITQTDEKKGVPNTCYPGWKYFKLTNKCYRNFEQPQISYEEAKSICSRNNAMPVSLNIKEEHSFVIDKFGQEGRESAIAWIGLHSSGGIWKWADGMEAEPKWNKFANKKNKCAQLLLSGTNDILDFECKKKSAEVICEAFPIVSNVCES